MRLLPKNKTNTNKWRNYITMKIFEDCLVSDCKGLIKIALVGSMIFLVMTISLAYLFVRILKMNMFISEVIIIVIVAAAIVYVYQKHYQFFYKKMLNI